MKKLLVLFIVLAMASVANAGLVDLVVTSYGQQTDMTSPIAPTKAITIDPSDYIDLDILYTAPVGYTLWSLAVDVTLVGPGSLHLDQLTGLETTIPWDLRSPAGIGVTENIAGKSYTIDLGTTSGIVATGAAIPVLDHILMHCDGGGQVVISMVDNQNTVAGGTYETDDMFNFATPTLGDDVIVTQTPEPATLLLLGVGGLLLRRRK